MMEEPTVEKSKHKSFEPIKKKTQQRLWICYKKKKEAVQFEDHTC